MYYLSLGARFLCNVEALNMVESIGNLTKHRRAPYIIKEKEGWKLLYVPAASGESFAHAYQQALVDVSRIIYGENPPIDEWSLRGEFIKFGDRQHMSKKLVELIDIAKKMSSPKDREKLLQAKHEVELEAVKESLVVDIGGFMIAEDVPVRRTSAFQVGYILPVYDALSTVAIESQLQARQIVSETIKPAEKQAKEEEKSGEQKTDEKQAKEEEKLRGQMLYYVEIASAVYGLTFNIDLEAIGRTRMIKVENAVDENERKRRMKVALGALAQVITGQAFGAKLSRYRPIVEIESLLVSLTPSVKNISPIFVVSPPQKRNFIEDTVERAKSFKNIMTHLGIQVEPTLVGFSKEVSLPKDKNIIDCKSPEEVFEKVVELIK